MANELKYTLGLDTGKFTQGVNQAEGSVNSFKQTAAAAGVGAAAGFGLATAAMKGVEMVAKTAQAGLIGVAKFLNESAHAAGELEQVTVRLKNFAKTAEEAADAAEQVNQFAQTPPFGIKESEAAAKALLKSGTAVKNLTGEMTVLGNVASAGGISLETMAAKYAYANEQGVVSLRELRELAQGGIPIFETLAKVTGQTPEQLKEALASGRVTFANYKAALNELGGEGKKFGSAMDDLGKTFEGQLATISGRWDGLKQTIGKPMIDMITPWLGVVADKIAWVTQIAAQGIEIVKSMVDSGTFGQALGIGVRAGLKEAVNYGVAGFEYLSKILIVGLGEAGTVMERLFSGDMATSFLKVLESAGVILQNGFLIALGELSKGMLTLAPKFLGYLNAGLDKVIEKALGVFGSSYKAESAEYYARQNTRDFGITELVDVVNSESKRLKHGIGEAINAAKEPIGTIGDTLITEVIGELLKKIAAVDFNVDDIAGAGAEWEKLKALAKEANPEAVEKLMKLLEEGTVSTESASKQMAQLAGASKELGKDMKAEEEARKRAAKSALELAKAMETSAQLAAKASGQYRQAAEMDYKQRFDEMVKDFVENKGLTTEQAQQMADQNLQNEAKYERRMERPRERERAEAAERKVRNSVALNGVLGLGGNLPGRPLGQSGIPLGQSGNMNRRMSGNNDLLPAAARQENKANNWQENVSQILSVLEGIASNFSKIQLAT